MPLKYRVKSLDDVPESARELYSEDGDGFVLGVEGVEAEEEVGKLKRAHERTKQELAKLREQAGRVSDADLDELQRLRAEAREREERKAKEEGRWDELRGKLQEEHKKGLDVLETKLKSRDEVIQHLTVTNELRSALTESGVRPEYVRAAELLLKERGPTVDWQDGQMPKGVFPDEVHGNRPIAEVVKEWAKSDDADAFMPRETKSGGGAGGDRGKGGQKSYEGKKFSEMTPDEQVAFTEEKYGAGAGAAA
jgi:hypothetical protein